MNPLLYLLAIVIGTLIGVGLTAAAIYVYERTSGRWFLFREKEQR